jgi:hypothetical protein
VLTQLSTSLDDQDDGAQEGREESKVEYLAGGRRKAERNRSSTGRLRGRRYIARYRSGRRLAMPGRRSTRQWRSPQEYPEGLVAVAIVFATAPRSGGRYLKVCQTPKVARRLASLPICGPSPCLDPCSEPQILYRGINNSDRV